jgi:hypothetical protein
MIVRARNQTAAVIGREILSAHREKTSGRSALLFHRAAQWRENRTTVVKEIEVGGGSVWPLAWRPQ